MEEPARGKKHVDVSVARGMTVSPEQVAAVMFDAAREPEWMRAVTAAGWYDAEIRPGAKAWQRGRFLGKDISWTTEVTGYAPDSLLAMRIDGGPFQGTVTYTLTTAAGGCEVTIRNQGEPTAFAWMPKRLLAAAMRTAMAKDLDRLASLVSSRQVADGASVG
jgi:hypothetical protein